MVTSISPLAGVIHGLDKLYCRRQLRPPVLLCAAEPFLVEAAHVLDRREQTRRVRLDQNVDEHGHEVIGRGDGLLVSHAQ